MRDNGLVMRHECNKEDLLISMNFTLQEVRNDVKSLLLTRAKQGGMIIIVAGIFTVIGWLISLIK